jgi:hypothetical protein
MTVMRNAMVGGKTKGEKTIFDKKFIKSLL